MKAILAVFAAMFALSTECRADFLRLHFEGANQFSIALVRESRVAGVLVPVNGGSVVAGDAITRNAADPSLRIDGAETVYRRLGLRPGAPFACLQPMSQIAILAGLGLDFVGREARSHTADAIARALVGASPTEQSIADARACLNRIREADAVSAFLSPDGSALTSATSQIDVHMARVQARVSAVIDRLNAIAGSSGR